LRSFRFLHSAYLQVLYVFGFFFIGFKLISAYKTQAPFYTFWTLFEQTTKTHFLPSQPIHTAAHIKKRTLTSSSLVVLERELSQRMMESVSDLTADFIDIQLKPLTGDTRIPTSWFYVLNALTDVHHQLLLFAHPIVSLPQKKLSFCDMNLCLKLGTDAYGSLSKATIRSSHRIVDRVQTFIFMKKLPKLIYSTKTIALCTF
jgi:hypothetical protein